MRQVVVLGGGISGLSLAFFIKNAWKRQATNVSPLRIHIIESSSQCGGWIQSQLTSNGFLFEYGPRGFRPARNGAEVLRLIEELHLQPQMLTVSSEAAHSRYILHNKRVEKIPTSISEMIQWPLSVSVCKSLVHELVTPQKHIDDESIYEFISRRFDPTIAERLIDPMASGIFGGDIRQLSIRSCFPLLYDLEKEYGSVLKGMIMNRIKSRKESDRLLDNTAKSDFIKENEHAVSISFRKGMSTLVQALCTDLENSTECSLLRNTKAVRLTKSTETRNHSSPLCVTVRNNKGEESVLRASDVYSTIPAKDLIPLVQETSPKLANTLSSIRYSTIGLTHLGYDAHVLNSGGFGYLVPTQEKENILGVVYDSCAFPEQNISNQPQSRLSVMCGGAHRPEVASLTSSQLDTLAIDAVSRHLNITAKCAYINSVILKDCIPQYHVGLHETRRDAERHAARLSDRFFLAGNSMYGIGLADCIYHSRKLAMQFVK